LPPEYVERSNDVVSNQLANAFGLDLFRYLLFVGAIEPKKMYVGCLTRIILPGVSIHWSLFHRKLGEMR
jgi:hypothetical protein